MCQICVTRCREICKIIKRTRLDRCFNGILLIFYDNLIKSINILYNSVSRIVFPAVIWRIEFILNYHSKTMRLELLNITKNYEICAVDTETHTLILWKEFFARHQSWCTYIIGIAITSHTLSLFRIYYNVYLKRVWCIPLSFSHLVNYEPRFNRTRSLNG